MKTGSDSNVVALFERQAAVEPDAVALVAGDRSWTYRALDEASSRLARYLFTRGLGSGTTAAVALERSAELVVGVLAILKTGAAYVPLESDAPITRLRTVLDDSAAALVLTESGVRPDLPDDKALRVDLDRVKWNRADSITSPKAGARRTGDSLAYIMYTSGSTGVPKGVAVPDRAIVRLVTGNDYAPFGPDQTFGFVSSPAFDASTFEIWGALLHGGRLAIYDDPVLDPVALGRFLARHRVTVLWLTAGLFNTIVDQDPAVLSAVKSLLIGGEALSVDHVRRAQSALPEVRLVNGYGPTEGTTFTCTYQIPRPVPPDWTTIPIGKPLNGTTVHLLDEDGQPVAPGKVGELFIGGAGLATGYWNDPALTAERFIAIAIPITGKTRFYRSGDLCRELPDGNLEFVGRKDTQIKLRGFRIELGEIEAALNQVPGVGQSAVVVEGEGDRRHLVAFWVAVGRALDPDGLRPGGGDSLAKAQRRKGKKPTTAETFADARAGTFDDDGELSTSTSLASLASLREKEPEFENSLSTKLPDYMIPARFVQLRRMPLTANGKIDRRALATEARVAVEGVDSAVNSSPDGRTGERTENETERGLAELWAELLSFDDVRSDSSFFALGGNSLIAMRVASRIQQSVGVAVSVRDILEHPILRELAATIDARRATNAGSLTEPASPEPPTISTIPGFERRASDVPFRAPVSFGQERFLVSEATGDLGSVNHESSLFWIDGDLDFERLIQSLRVLVERHEILRTRFVRDSDGATWHQEIVPPSMIDLTRCVRDVEMEGADVVSGDFVSRTGPVSAAALESGDHEKRAHGAHPSRDCVDSIFSARSRDARDRIRAKAKVFAAEPFAFGAAPLFRLGRIRCGEVSALVLTQHHIVCDDWSLRIFFLELSDLYAAQAEIDRAGLEPVPVQPADAAARERDQWERGTSRKHLDYWKRHLAGAPRLLELPADRSRPSVASYRGDVVEFTVPGRVIRAMDRLSAQSGATRFVALLAGFVALLHRYTASEDLVVGTPISQRTADGLQSALGFFLNMVPMRFHVQSTESFENALRDVHRIALDGLEHGAAPFEKIVEAIRPDRIGNAAPLFQTAFVLLNDPLPRLELTGARMRPELMTPDAAKYDLTLFLQRAGEWEGKKGDYEHEHEKEHGQADDGDHQRLGRPEGAPGGQADDAIAMDQAVGRVPRSSVAPSTTRSCDPAPDGSFRGWIEFSTDLFDRERIERMTAHYLMLLNAIAADPTCPLGELEILPPEESGKVLHEFSGREVGYPRDATVIDLFAEQAANRPSAVAVIGNRESVSYRSLDERSNQFARFLAGQGLQPGQPVPVTMNRSVELVMVWLGILKAGGIYVPLEPDAPEARSARMIADCGARWVVSDTDRPLKREAGSGSTGDVQVVRLDSPAIRDAIETASSDDLAIQRKPDDLAYIIYTSGSTGEPKGVAVPDRAIVRLVKGNDYAPFDPAQTFGFMASPAFDASTFEVWGALLNGAKLAVYDDTRMESDRVGEFLRRHQVSVLWLTAALFNTIVDEDSAVLAGVTTLLIGGEALSVDHVRRAQAALPDVQIVNGYGPTEGTTFTCTYPIPRPIPDDWSSIPIGRPLNNTRVWILDSHRKPVPIGVNGELYIGGDGLAAGYWNDPALTLEKFPEHALDSTGLRPGRGESPAEAQRRRGDEVQGRLSSRRAFAALREKPSGANDRTYKTGDLCRWRPDGTIEFIGRKDGQIKLRGFRIELEEIESVLNRSDDVAQSAVCVVGEGDRRHLVAFWVAPGGALDPDGRRPGGGDSLAKAQKHKGRTATTADTFADARAETIDDEGEPTTPNSLASLAFLREKAPELQKFLSTKLPAYMIPARFVQRERMPVTSNGKVDRQALLEMANRSPAPLDSEPRPLLTDSERQVAAVWSDLLGVAVSGATDHFFHLGGHSLLALRAASRLTRAFDFEVGVGDVFRYQTVSALATVLDARRRERSSVSSKPGRIDPSLVRLERPGAETDSDAFTGPLSFGQQRLWLLDQLEQNSDVAAYNVPVLWMLSGTVDIRLFEACLRELAARHESLRTRVIQQNGEPVQQILPVDQVKIQVHQVTVDADSKTCLDSDSALPAELGEAIGEQMARRLPLDRVPLWTATLFHCGCDSVLGLNLHHILCDEWSLRILAEELSALYRAGGDPAAAGLGEVRIQPVDIADWQRRQWASGAWRSQLAFWEQHLAGAPPLLALPADRPRTLSQSWKGGTAGFAVSRETAEALAAIGQRADATPFMTFLAAFYVLLQRIAGREDIVVGTPVSHRGGAEELEDVVGFFLNTLPLRLRIEGDRAFQAILRDTRRAAMALQENRDAPFEKIVETVRPDRTASPVFQVAFVYLDEPPPNLQLPGVESRWLFPPVRSSKFDLTLFMERQEDGGARGWFEFRTDLFDRDRIMRLADHWRTLLESIVANPERPIGALQILPTRERHLVQELFAGAQVPYPRDSDAVTLFDEEVNRDPDRTAVRCGGVALTYGELNKRANRLSRYLGTQGAGPNETVLVGLNRSADLVVAWLAIWKAGAAYVPLEVEAPSNRLRQIAHDSGASLLLSRSGLLAELSVPGVSRIDLDTLGPDLERESTGTRERPSTADNDPERVAYVIYTSGSTGQPKGVAVPHRAIVRLVRGNDYAPFDRDQTFAFVASPAFDASTFEVWGALLNGACLAIYDSPTIEVQGLKRFLDERKVSVLWLTAALFNTIIDEDPSVLAGVTTLLIGGEVLSVNHMRRAQAALPDVRIVNGYGPTEGTTFTCTYPIPRPVPDDWVSIPIGRPLNNTRVWILDDRRQPVPIGVDGELYIGGDGLAVGYWNDPRLTMEKFPRRSLDPKGLLPEEGESSAEAHGRRGDEAQGLASHCAIAPLREKPPGANDRVYMTGDIGRWRPDGTIEFIGRKDGQIKLRGFRIELEEIESVLNQFDEVAQSAVCVVGEGDRRHLVAFWVSSQRAQPRATLDPGGLRPDGGDSLAETQRRKGKTRTPEGTPASAHAGEVDDIGGHPAPASQASLGLSREKGSDFEKRLATKLPAYMIPARFVRLERMPVTSNGKVDRRRLALIAAAAAGPAGPGEPAASVASRIPPVDDMERRLFEVWQDLLQTDDFGVTDSFFDVGGHSLLATRLVRRIEVLSGQKFGLASVFAAPTIREQAAALKERREYATKPSVITMREGDAGLAPLFCIHYFFFYHYLAPLLKEKRPVLVAHIPVGKDRISHGDQPLTRRELAPTHEELASDYVALIRERQPSGPYFLTGGSYGGVLAYEIAQQLISQGEDVAFLGLLDTVLPGAEIPIRWRQALAMARRIKSLKPGPALEALGRRVERVRAKWRRLAGKAGVKFVEPDRNRIVKGWEARVVHDRDQSVLDYRAKPYCGRGNVYLFRATDRSDIARLGYSIAPDCGWSKIVGNRLVTFDIPGNHDTFFKDDNAAVLAEAFNQCLVYDSEFS